MGDDTWMSVFPDTFEPNMTFPYDSFNVEDLHTVDEGVIKHLFPLLEDPSKPFDFLIGHFLGVDHVGHRVGPDHPSMKAKLQQMNDVLTRVVEKMDDNTLLIVLGDHGMDRAGDHGGDGILETSSAMWIYSKGHALIDTSLSVPSGLLQFKTFPGTTIRHRSIQQIDILPTLSLLLGLPIPYNNLGTVIPELFWHDHKGRTLERALQINVAQIMRYLDTYRSSPSGGELDEGWKNIQSAWTATQTSGVGETNLVTLMNFNRVALAACRTMWAQFNPILMSLGLLLLGADLCATWSVYSGLSALKGDWNPWLTKQLKISVQVGAGGAVLGFLGHLGLRSYSPGVDSLDCIIFVGSLLSAITLIVSTPPNISFSTLKSTPVILILHTIAFLSNSFTFWEDRVVGFLLVSSIVPYALVGLNAPNKRLRYRILGFSFLFAVCVRLISISTVCREEQQPYCNVTFYASSSVPSPPLLVLGLVIPTMTTLPYVIKKFMQISRSDRGVSKTHLPIVLAPSLIAGSIFWLMEWADSATLLGDDWSSLLRLGRTWLARLTFGWGFFVGGTLWWLMPVCLDIDVIGQGEKRQVQVIGYANAFGSPYFIFWTLFLSLISISTQLTGQLVLALGTVALMAYLEVLDSVRDVKGIAAAVVDGVASSSVPVASSNLSPPVQFMDVIPLALLGVHMLYGTGHQSTITSLQWKSAFLLTPTVAYPFSPITVVLNSLGPTFLMALGAPLLALWNRAPLADSQIKIKRESILSSLSMMIYYTGLLLGTSVSAAILRRHLMVWKVFAPRFMAAVLELLAVDVAVVLGVGVGVERVEGKILEIFAGYGHS